MESELVSIKESSQGCRGNGWQQCCYCLIIQNMITREQESRGCPTSEITNSGLLRNSHRSNESGFLFQFCSWDPERGVI